MLAPLETLVQLAELVLLDRPDLLVQLELSDLSDLLEELVYIRDQS